MTEIFKELAMQLKKLLLIMMILSMGFLGACVSTPYQESTGQYIDNTVITSRVKTGLLADPLVKGLGITVTSFKGTVELSGRVDSDRERQRALAITWATPGVTHVVDHLILN